MKKKLLARCIAIILCTASLFSLLAGCTGKGEGKEESTPGPNAAESSGVPNRGAPDRSDLAYPDAIEAYQKTDWSADWIWTKSCSEDSYVAFRKTFTLDEDITSATAFISAVDKYVLWVNGEMVVLDGSPKRGPTPYDSYYDEVELTNLKRGENVIALQVAFNGRSGDGSIVPIMADENGDEFPQAGLLFELKAGSQTVASDSSFKALKLEAYKNRRTAGADYPNYPQASMLAERNVYFDARDAIGDWMAPGFDDSAWEDAALVAKPGELPFGGLYDAMIDPICFYDRVDFEQAGDYVGRELAQDTKLELTLPRNTQFTFYFELTAPAGKRLTVYTDTYQYQDEISSFKDTYVTGDGAQSYENYPWRSGTKLIIEAEAGVTFTRLAYRISEFDSQRTPAFTSSAPQLDQLWLEAQNTVLVCMRDTFMDCPERERGPYMGDASNEVDAALYGFDDAAQRLIKKAILNTAAWTRKDGGIPSRAPSVKPQEIPIQSLAFLTSAYNYWLHSGDVETMTAYYKISVDYLKLFDMENGLPVYRAGTWTWDDWGGKIDKNLLQVGFYYYALNLTSRLGDELGIDGDKVFFTERMTSIKENFRAAYYTPEGFRSAESPYVDERANALLALSGLADAADYDLIANVIATTYEASPFCEKYILEAACVMGRTDLALKRMLDRYALMLHDEYDTLWEQFWPDDGTINHGWTAAPLYILSKYVAGIQPTSGGFETYTIAPADVLESFSCTEYTEKGTLTVRLEKADGEAVLTIGAIGGEGTVRIPRSMGSEISVTGGNYELLGDNDVKITDAATYTIRVR